MMAEPFGFREIEHTADLELHVWAPDLSLLLEQAAKGMYALSGTKLLDAPRISREFHLSFLDPESLVVDFLSEILFFSEEDSVGFDSFRISQEQDMWFFQLDGAPIQSHAKEIKAVTFHGIKVRKTEAGLEVNIVFDV
jgi:SHS2 domain-containing protein